MKKFIKIEPFDNGAHDNYTINSELEQTEGWAVIPDDMEVPDTFPFVNIKVKDGIVTEMTPGAVHKAEPLPVTEMEKIRADIDYLSAIMGVEL